jgi:bifunctional non-homologous end joining protein LigD
VRQPTDRPGRPGRPGRPERRGTRRAAPRKGTRDARPAEPTIRPKPRRQAEPEPALGAKLGPELIIDGKRLRLSHLDKVYYPATGFTKAEVIDYYRAIAPALLPHLRGRPLTLKRYPEGVGGEHFYETRCPPHRPPWVKTAPIWSQGHGRMVDYCVVEDLATLIWAVNLADLEFHVSLSLARAMDRPATMVFDLDPGEPASIIECAQVGLWVREIFDSLGLKSFPKTSGSKGLQVYVPLNTSGSGSGSGPEAVTYDDTKSFSHAIARLLEQEHPTEVVSLMRKSLRHGKVFVDWSQNDEHKTTVCVYSLRARERPTVSTPVLWEEVEEAARRRDARVLTFTAAEALARYREHGDLFAPVLHLRQALPHLGPATHHTRRTRSTTPSRRAHE